MQSFSLLLLVVLAPSVCPPKNPPLLGESEHKEFGSHPDKVSQSPFFLHSVTD